MTRVVIMVQTELPPFEGEVGMERKQGSECALVGPF